MNCYRCSSKTRNLKFSTNKATVILKTLYQVSRVQLRNKEDRIWGFRIIGNNPLGVTIIPIAEVELKKRPLRTKQFSLL